MRVSDELAKAVGDDAHRQFERSGPGYVACIHREHVRDIALDLRDARKERDEARETNGRLNRRCQEYEAGLAAKLDSPLAEGRTFGRVLANSAATLYMSERDTALALLRDCEPLAHRDDDGNCLPDEPHEPDCPGCRAKKLLEGKP